MTLRNRLLLALTAVFVIFAIAAVVTVLSQRQALNDQVDEQLLSTPLPPGREAPPGVAEPPQNSARTAGAPISDLYMATIDEAGEVSVVVQGQRLEDVPDLEALPDPLPPKDELLTVPGVEGISEFRLFVARRDLGQQVVVALPLDAVQSSVNRLAYTLGGVLVLIGVALVLAWYWVSRFGLRPIAEMTSTADAIAGGDRTRRATEYDEGTEAGRLATAFNVMLDERDSEEERLRSFVSNASHELRTPLTSLRGYLDLYTEGGFRGEGQLDDAIRRMTGESARMQLLVEDLLQLAKFDEHQELDLVDVDVERMLGDVADAARVAHSGRVVEVSVGDIGELRADRLRLHQAVAAVVDNAMTHTEAPGVVRLNAHTIDGDVAIVVSDEGPGIGDDDLHRVFERFYRGDDSRARSTGGSGLGLAITRSIIEAHGGQIEAAQGADGGAVFTIRVPRASSG
ncbi:MAG: HAMP domain-containing sensor histidine kinase [Acidimicrobiia bacterium]|nr:HAMP domain-containing sensor histidine kinase [Acidimicrobiia bacterium]